MAAPIHTGDTALDQLGLHAHWLLRLAFTGVFLYMGIDKFMGGGIAEFAAASNLPALVATLVALAEITAGVLVIAGAFAGGWVTRLGALAAVPVLLGAILMAHWGQWHFLPTATHPMGGMMFQVTLLFLAVYMLVRGNEI